MFYWLLQSANECAGRCVSVDLVHSFIKMKSHLARRSVALKRFWRRKEHAITFLPLFRSMFRRQVRSLSLINSYTKFEQISLMRKRAIKEEQLSVVGTVKTVVKIKWIIRVAENELLIITVVITMIITTVDKCLDERSRKGARWLRSERAER